MSHQASGMRDADLDDLCARWPGATRAIKWEVDLVWSVAGKMFVALCTLGPDRGRLSFKVEPEQYAALSGRPGMMPAPYTGSMFWISVTEPERFSTADLAAWVRGSYDLVRATLPKKTQDALDAS
ncbi:MAG: MmcQ/YjbR family DNA-binding protein [Dokdonella sp.]|nr:MmcQ/YjbR family DNA-binding protein [Dokdonella sp.]MBX3699623.1 MmcQ/YjbR family DNA-binding protein [Dokdonella sp.]